MSKNETQALFELITKFIHSLSEEQYRSLISGKGKIEFKENNQGDDKRIEKIKKSRTIREVERNCTGMLKKDIISVCESLKIDAKKRDTKKVLFQKIAAHFQIKDENEDDELIKVKETLQKFKSPEEAKEYLTNQQLLKTKKDIIHLAKLLDVYINPKHTKTMILNRIIESVIGSQLSAQAIRGGT
ncbi:hypothetical protein [Salinibacillus xinjiangensis]|uniref:Uncharacterized protein n=1 Tax=Salinibacillus xinjiangensis TaxID=1229268 RepID=A0A6G1X731_9BACI|nr:hypothetical protein [Salinibacillus xinjiangensis]MRG86774.1 hypothetical protein [Salinibacillus xinjiangensis]